MGLRRRRFRGTRIRAVLLREKQRDGASEGDTLFKWSFPIGGAVQYAILIAIALAISRDLPEARALRRPQIGLAPMIGWGALAIAGAYVGTLVIQAAGGNPVHEQGLLTQHWHSGEVAPFIASALVISLLGPYTEELLIRGNGFGLLRPYGQSVALCVPALAWSLMHGLPAAILPLFLFGVGLGYLRERSQSIIPGMVVHALFNAFQLALMFT